MFSTGDLLPQQSGSASIGVQQLNGIGGIVPGSIKPYNRIHFVSGVIHEPIFGQSGVLRYAQYAGSIEVSRFGLPVGYMQDALEISTNGGLDFPLRLGAASGHGVIQTLPNVNNQLFILTSGTCNIVSQNDLELRALNDVDIHATRILNLEAEDSIEALSQYTAFDSYIDTVFETVYGNLFFNAGIGVGVGLGGQIEFNAFASSGRLQYRFGPDQGWYAKLTHAANGGPFNDGFWPVPHSGQIAEMIKRREKPKTITIERPAVNNDLTIWYTNEAITITEVESVVRGSFDASGQFAIRHSTNRNLAGTELTTQTISCSNRTTGQITTSFAAPNIPADSWIWIGISGVSGTVTNQLSVSLQYI